MMTNVLRISQIRLNAHFVIILRADDVPDGSCRDGGTAVRALHDGERAGQGLIHNPHSVLNPINHYVLHRGTSLRKGWADSLGFRHNDGLEDSGQLGQ